MKGRRGTTVADPLLKTRDTRYGQLTVFANDSSAIAESLAQYGEWAENEMVFLRHLIDEGATVLDVGAYIGTHALAFSRIVGTSGNVICLEPQKHAFDLLKMNMDANGLRNVRLENAVASFEPGRALIPSINIKMAASYASASLLSTLSPEINDVGVKTAMLPATEIEVPAITIDLLGLRSCALIKIDAEGMEELVLRGALHTIKQYSPIIYAECNSLEHGLRTFALLKAAGYKVRAHVVAAFNPDNFRRNHEDIFNGACEVALVGFPETAVSRMEHLPVRSCELLLAIDTADDLALALLNKPQYATEVLRAGAAALTGGGRYFDQADGDFVDAQWRRRLRGKLRSLLPWTRRHS
jgi:FkbM family methyltransferase